ncbi:error-prone DNA polymerase [Roseibium sp.]|uniref:error-prone DNA polymerase n=1 Tax=Roseibium sp. TaxID=1936156 RepID=UPI003A973553
MPDPSPHQYPRPPVSLPSCRNENPLAPATIDGTYAELCITTNFTFLKGASHPEEFMVKAAELGLEAIAITDTNSLAGVVRAFSARKEMLRQIEEQGLKVQLPRLIVGARLELEDSNIDWVALPTDRAAYQRLTRLLTTGKRRSEKGSCLLHKSDLLEWGKGMILIALPPREDLEFDEVLPELHHIARHFPSSSFLGCAPNYDGKDQPRLTLLATLARRVSIPMVAVGDVLMHTARRRQLADVLSALRLGVRIDEIGRNALPNSERRLKGYADMARLFRNYPGALRRTFDIAGRCTFDLSELSYQYPDEISDGEDPQDRLVRLTRAGLKRRFPAGISADTAQKVEKELALIEKMGFAAYFLTVHDIVEYARSQGILCQGRGSAANSILCYALGITEVGPDVISMVFERFISEARGEPPDIDVDFEHERREEVIQYIYAKYGRHRAGLCATVIHFRGRSAIREVGKVMGLSQDVLAALTGRMWSSSPKEIEVTKLKELGLNPDDKRLRLALDLIREITGFPRHLSQHVGGFIITKDRLDELCPIENAAMEDRTVIEWDKDDIDALGILKVDILSLGMLTCIRKCFDLVQTHERFDWTLATIPHDDAATYDMLCEADAIGVFQVESRAQMNFLPRMRPRKFYDLVIEVAIIRPGPIQGDMVHPYIRRRNGQEPVSYPSRELTEILGKTLGVPLFQEQAMQIAIVAAGFSPDEADRLRRSLATFKRMGTISSFRDKFVAGMRAKGYSPEFTERCFSQIEGFGEYGFPESHAASFALLAYASAFLKRHHPAAFACALLNSQPMGFYAPAQIVRDARDHGIEVRAICVNNSDWDHTLEQRLDGQLAIRLGFRLIKGFKKEDAEWIIAARGNGYTDLETLWLRAGIAPATLERLAEADAFLSLQLSRRDALWQAKAIKGDKPLPLFSNPIDGEAIYEQPVTLPPMHLGEQVVEDYVSMRLSLKAHPMEVLRPKWPELLPHHQLRTIPLQRVCVCGLVITRQRPGTASGVIFLTLEDETGTCNVVIWPKIYEKYRRQIISGRLLKITGKMQREGIVTHVIAEQVTDVTDALSLLGHPDYDVVGRIGGVNDEAPRVQNKSTQRARHPREQAKALFPSRDFH